MREPDVRKGVQDSIDRDHVDLAATVNYPVANTVCTQGLSSTGENLHDLLARFSNPKPRFFESRQGTIDVGSLLVRANCIAVGMHWLRGRFCLQHSLHAAPASCRSNWWRRGESNPLPKSLYSGSLRAYFAINLVDRLPANGPPKDMPDCFRNASPRVAA